MILYVLLSGPYISLKNLVASLSSAVCFSLHLNQQFIKGGSRHFLYVS